MLHLFFAVLTAQRVDPAIAGSSLGEAQRLQGLQLYDVIFHTRFPRRAHCVSTLKFIEINWGLSPITARIRDNLPNPSPIKRILLGTFG